MSWVTEFQQRGYVMLASLQRSLTSCWPQCINNSCGNSWHTEQRPVAHWLSSQHIKHPHIIGKITKIPGLLDREHFNENGYNMFSCYLLQKGPCWCEQMIFITPMSLNLVSFYVTGFVLISPVRILPTETALNVCGLLPISGGVRDRQWSWRSWEAFHTRV